MTTKSFQQMENILKTMNISLNEKDPEHFKRLQKSHSILQTNPTSMSTISMRTGILSHPLQRKFAFFLSCQRCVFLVNTLRKRVSVAIASNLRNRPIKRPITIIGILLKVAFLAYLLNAVDHPVMFWHEFATSSQFKQRYDKKKQGKTIILTNI
jgi:hypothetical protein